MKTKILLPVIAVIIAGSAFGAVSTFAQTSSDPNSTIIQKIAQKFGLKEADVKSVFEEARTARMKEMQTRMEDRLNQAVKDGKITEAQKKLITDKQAELKTKRESEKANMKNMTFEQRKAAMKAEKDEIQKWATDNGIDIQYLFGGFRGGMKRGFGPRK